MMSTSVLVVHAPAKVNLYLEVGGRRPDGYHDVTTVLHALEFGDTVTLAPASSLSLTCDPGVGLPPESNLAYRAARAMAERFGRDPAVAIGIEKRIPAGAGLGGASADAAAVVLGLSLWWGLDPLAADVVDVARSLGADVPFFLTGGAALYTGRGDVFVRRLPALIAPVVVVKPAEPVPTAAAYGIFDTLTPAATTGAEVMLDALASGDARQVAQHLHNNLTDAAVHLVPAIRDALALTASCPGVLGVAVAGSGSSVFGVCESPAAASAAADSGRAAGLWSVATAAAPGGCAVIDV